MKNIILKTEIPGPESKKMLERRNDSMPNGFAKSTQVVVERSEGALVWDVDGNQMIDFAGGIGMLNAGHRPPQVVKAIKEQLDKSIHSCMIVATNEPAVELCELLNEYTPGDFPKKTLLANSGAEAVENAVNIAKYYTKRPAVIVFEGGYHGRTYLTMSMTSKYGLFKKGYGSFASDIYRLPAPNMYRPYDGMTEEQYLDHCVKQLDHALIAQVDPSAIAAIVIEPVQGEAGFIPIPKEFLQKIRTICDEHGIVMIADEVQSGFGRTGKLFAIEHAGVIPDMVTTAKSLGSGMPISAVTGKAEIMDAPHPGAIGGTYSGSPITSVAAIETFKIINDPAFLKRANEIGDLIAEILEEWKEKYAFIGDVRGVGGMRIVEFVKDKKTREPDIELGAEIIGDATTKGILLIRAGLYSNCIRLLPPFAITDDQIKEGLAVLEGAIKRAHEKRGK
ncbi:MAG: 4-aminobutyrate--2-oxoglutarate transaminase [Flavobacteriia bacterium]|nr:MAG: 4-aminobutyrate--2-oxoglutarate transaminase [Flavobacteriia bacterium]